jgi:hypothetical protein
VTSEKGACQVPVLFGQCRDGVCAVWHVCAPSRERSCAGMHVALGEGGDGAASEYGLPLPGWEVVVQAVGLVAGGVAGGESRWGFGANAACRPSRLSRSPGWMRS